MYSKFTVQQEDDESTVITATSTNVTLQISSASSTVMPESTNSVNVASQSFCASSEGLPSLAPYINRSTLKYLDSRALEQNMQIRHDLVLEANYRLGVQQSESAEHLEMIREEYWSNIRLELAELALPDVPNAPRLCALIGEIRELMCELYPRCELVTGQLIEALDEGLIIQQLKHNLLNLPDLFNFLSVVMKKNCAPKRDGEVDLMLAHAQQGRVLEALQACLQLMEGMKLDLANYKLDQIRPHVAQSAITIERKFFELMLTNSKITLDLTKKWLSESCDGKAAHEVFVEAAIKLLVCPFVRDTSVPETFILDKKRLISMHSAFQDLCIVQCLLLIYKQNCGNAPRSLAGDRLKEELLRLLSRPETQISDIVGVMSRAIADFRKQLQVPAADFNTIHAAINKIIAPENELFLMVEKKLLSLIRNHLCKKADSRNTGLSDLNVADKITELSEQMSKLVSFNWHVFEPLYQNLIETCKK